MLLFFQLFVRSLARAAISTSTSGAEATPDYRVHFSDSDKAISPWHDIPLKAGDLFHFINEIPKFTRAKMEVATKEINNPIAQDIKKGEIVTYHYPL
ncbi:hypothetical protein EON65_32210 [archaeon]|nr:MAG: hypothetical protein EON65_32210 [archaeon]